MVVAIDGRKCFTASYFTFCCVCVVIYFVVFYNTARSRIRLCFMWREAELAASLFSPCHIMETNSKKMIPPEEKALLQFRTSTFGYDHDDDDVVMKIVHRRILLSWMNKNSNHIIYVFSYFYVLPGKTIPIGKKKTLCFV